MKVKAILDPQFIPMALLCREMREATEKDGQDIVIGIEFIKMLAKHSPGSSLEVLLYAIARHLVVGHDSAVENLLSVGAIALIFIVRKFFFVPAFGAHLPDGHPAPDLTPAQSGIPADWFRRRHSEAKPEEETEIKE